MAATEEGPVDALRQAVAHAENLIGSTLELVARSGAAQWCAYLVPHEDQSWRVALATGAGAPDLGSVWSPAEVERFVGTTRADLADDAASLPEAILRYVHLPRAAAGGGPHGLLCAAPNVQDAATDHQGVADTLHTLLDHLTALVTHHADHVGRAAAVEADRLAGPPLPTATEDPVTGLLTKSLVLARLGDEVARAKRYGGGLSVLLCDFDQLSTVADVAGAAGRDANLAAVGADLRAHLRQIDCAGRYGDHSLLLVLPETGADESLRAATRLAQFIADAVATVDLSTYLLAPQSEVLNDDSATAAPAAPAAPAVLLRVGASTFPAPAKSADELVSQAQDALHAVRESGGEAWLGHALDRLNEAPAGGFRCVCRRCGTVFQVMDRAQQRARRFCSHECYTAARREGGQERDDLIRELRQQGQSLRAIGRHFGISAERVRQILDGAAGAAPPGFPAER